MLRGSVGYSSPIHFVLSVLDLLENVYSIRCHVILPGIFADGEHPFSALLCWSLLTLCDVPSLRVLFVSPKFRFRTLVLGT